MIKDGLSSCQAEKELEYLRVENVALRAQLDAEKRRADAAVEDLYMACKHTPCNTGVCTTKGCKGNRIPCEFEWRGVKEERE